MDFAQDMDQTWLCCACITEQGAVAVQGALGQGFSGSGASAVRPPHALKPDKTASAVEQANTAAVRALDRSRRVPGVKARAMQIQAGKENSSKDAANNSSAPPARSKRPLSQPRLPPRCAVFSTLCR